MKIGRAPDKKVFGISRRQLITGASATGGLLLGSAFPKTAFGLDDDDNPACRTDSLCETATPIPHINKFLQTTFGVKAHFYFPGSVEGTFASTDPEKVEPGGRDPSTIYDFKGFIGQADLNLTGTGTDLNTGASQKYSFHTDTRFMTGTLIGADGRRRESTFAFV